MIGDEGAGAMAVVGKDVGRFRGEAQQDTFSCPFNAPFDLSLGSDWLVTSEDIRLFEQVSTRHLWPIERYDCTDQFR